jgi:hypothetical protein
VQVFAVTKSQEPQRVCRYLGRLSIRRRARFTARGTGIVGTRPHVQQSGGGASTIGGTPAPAARDATTTSTALPSAFRRQGRSGRRRKFISTAARPPVTGTPTLGAPLSSFRSHPTESHGGRHVLDAGTVTAREVGHGPGDHKDHKMADLRASISVCGVCCRMPLTPLQPKDGDMTTNGRRLDAIVAVTREDLIGKPI